MAHRPLTRSRSARSLSAGWLSCARAAALLAAIAGPLRSNAQDAATQPSPSTQVVQIPMPAAGGGSALYAAEPEDELLLPADVSSADVQMRGRYVRQWRSDDDVLVLVYQGDFQLTFGKRVMRAADAVIWITPERVGPEQRKAYSLTVYLSDDAEVSEPSGTLTQDTVLLVSNLRTYGRVIKEHDAHAPQPGESMAFYERAVRDRQRIEQALQRPAESAEPGQVARAADADVARIRRPPRPVRYRVAGIEPATTPDGEQVLVMAGRVSFLQTGSTDAATLEIAADRAVVFPLPGSGGSMLQQLDEPGAQPPGAAATQPTAGPAASTQPAARGDEERGEQLVRAVYLEGDVTLSLGDRFVRAERLYYDFENDRALILDAVFRAEMPERGIPLYVRAAEVRQLSPREFTAENARVTTSEFYTPHYHVGAERVIIRDQSQRDASGNTVGPVRGAYQMYNTTFNVENTPFLWWPYTQGDFTGTETALRRFRFGFGGRFGVSAETTWDLHSLLGAQRPPGHDARLHLDYFGKRGPAIGLDYDYTGQDHYGLFRSYYVYDQGEDRLGPLREDEEIPENENRGRSLWRHRHFLPNDWELTLEVSYISDPNFLEEWFRSEYQEGKEQETLVYLKRARGNEAITLLANWRILDFTTQTEHLPDLTYRRIGDTFLDPLVLYTEARVGNVRYRPDDRDSLVRLTLDNEEPTDLTFRTDGREEAELPLKLGPVNVVPFVSGRGSWWDGQPHGQGGLWRGLGVYGVRAATIFSRVFSDVQSELLDIDGIRHIIKPDLAAWGAGSNTRSELLSPFDYGVESVDDFYGVTVGLRQTWQTKRGAAANRRTVDLLTVNLEAGVFGNVEGRDDESNGYVNPLRPENSRARNYIAGEMQYRISDTTALLYDVNYDMTDRGFDRQAISIAWERPPRAAYLLGLRYAGDIDMNLVGGGFNYQLSEKYTLASRAWFDIETGAFGEGSLGLVRKLPRWYFGVNFEYSDVDDDFSILLSLWPEGIPEWTIGSRRFTQLGTSTGIRP